MGQWRIYYDDGSTRNYTEGLPTEPAQKLGIQCVVQRRSSDGVFVPLQGMDFYLFIDGQEWVLCDQTGANDWNVNHRDRVNCMIVGRAIPKDQFKKIYEQAKSDAAKCTLD